MIWIRLFYEFFKAGLFAIGGGLATLPFLQEISQATGWFTQQDLMDLIAISESTRQPMQDIMPAECLEESRPRLGWWPPLSLLSFWYPRFWIVLRKAAWFSIFFTGCVLRLRG